MSDADKLRSDLAHLVKTPLTVISGYAELLRLRSDDEIRAEASARITEAAARLNAVLDDVVERVVLAEAGALVRSGVSTRAPHLATSPVRAVPADGNGHRHSLLLVDDDDALRSLLQMTFSSDEYDVREASDADGALALVREDPPQLIVLDWRLPGKPGSHVLGELQRTPARPPVIVLTASADQRDHAMSLGADCFLVKPFSPIELLAEVDRLLERSTDGAGTSGAQELVYGPQ